MSGFALRAAERARPYRWDLLPRVSRAAVRVERVLAAHLGEPGAWTAAPAALARAFGDQPPALELGSPEAWAQAELAARVGPAPCAVCLRRADGKAIVALVEPTLAARAAARLLGTVEPLPGPRAPSRVERGVVAGLAALAVEHAGAPGLVVEAVEHEPAAIAARLAEPWIVTVEATLRAPALSGRVRLCFPESLLGAAPPARRRVARLMDLVWPAPVILATAALAREVLAALAPGDVVVPGGGASRARATLRLGPGGWPVTLDDAGLTIAGPWQHGLAMAERDALADQLSLPLDVRVARVETSLAELAALAPGAVIGLQRPLGAAVELCAGERVVARGELVEIDGELGVRVTAIL